jgi:D-alanyl-D-alanine carboxypeptidase
MQGAGWLLLVAACGSSGPAMPDAALSACAAQDRALQAALDGGLTSTAGMLAVHTPACGTHSYVSGNPAYASTESLWRIASVTKTFTAATVMSLVQDGTIGLDTPIANWVTVPNTTGVTLKMLLDHRSGIFNYVEDSAYAADIAANPGGARTPQQLVDFANLHAPYFAPGADFHYSNTNYILLGMIVEAVTGMKAGAAIHARAIGPAGLASTFLDGEDTIDAARLARGFEFTDDVTFKYAPSLSWTADGMVTSGADLADWLAALYDGTHVLDASHRALVLEPLSMFPDGASYGLGAVVLPAWSAASASAGAAEGHGGAMPGFEVNAFYFPTRQTAIVAATNFGNRDPGPLVDTALQTLFAP